MEHPIKSNTRVVSPLARLFYLIFNRGDPRALAVYHVVPERRGTLWIHCHGLQRRGASNLEFTGVPPEFRDEAIELMFALVGIARSKRGLAEGGDFADRFTARGQRFAEIGTVRATARTDAQHAGVLRVVDYGKTLADGFPKRLFAAHLVAKADAAKDPKQQEILYRKALDIFPGDFAEMNEGADIDSVSPDLTALQHKCNVGAYFGLAEALRTLGKGSEAVTISGEAIARAPGWAEVCRNRILQSGGPEDRYFRYWQGVDIIDVAMRQRSAAPSSGPARPSAAVAGASNGFGSRRDRRV